MGMIQLWTFQAQSEPAQEGLLATVGRTGPSRNSPRGGCPFTGLCDACSSFGLTLTSVLRSGCPESQENPAREFGTGCAGGGAANPCPLSSQGTHSEEWMHCPFWSISRFSLCFLSACKCSIGLGGSVPRPYLKGIGRKETYLLPRSPPSPPK